MRVSVVAALLSTLAIASALPAADFKQNAELEAVAGRRSEVDLRRGGSHCSSGCWMENGQCVCPTGCLKRGSTLVIVGALPATDSKRSADPEGAPARRLEVDLRRGGSHCSSGSWMDNGQCVCPAPCS